MVGHILGLNVPYVPFVHHHGAFVRLVCRGGVLVMLIGVYAFAAYRLETCPQTTNPRKKLRIPEFHAVLSSLWTALPSATRRLFSPCKGDFSWGG